MERKTLMYRSQVEYGGWTINHVQGCSHGCKYPCYAMSLAKRTGRVKTYDQWCRPEIVENAAQLLVRELARYGETAPSVHLCFTTDPFMWDSALVGPNKEVSALTMKLIHQLNAAGIRVTTLTKGVYPDDFIVEARSLHPDNQYGVSVVSLSEHFRKEWEPGAAPIERRMQSIEGLAAASLRTWVSVEPYPTPNVDSSASDPSLLLERLLFVDRVVFGRWNYSALINSFAGVDVHYAGVAQAFSAWAKTHGKPLHIKKGTPLAEDNSVDVLDVSTSAARMAVGCVQAAR